MASTATATAIKTTPRELPPVLFDTEEAPCSVVATAASVVVEGASVVVEAASPEIVQVVLP